MAKAGSVVEVYVSPRGSQLVGDHASAATTLLVADPTPFDTNGGQVLVDGTAYSYASMTTPTDTTDPTDVNGLLSLTSGLVAAVTDLTPVDMWNGAQILDDLTVLVTVSDEGDQPLPIVVDSNNRDKWEARLGPLDPPVAVTVSDDYTTVLDAPGYTPQINGAAIVNLPDPAQVAIDPPAASPEIIVQGNAQGLLVITDPILPTTLLDFYVNGVLVAQNQRTTILQLWTTDLAGTVPLAADTDYTVDVLAQNSAGPAPAHSGAKVARLVPGVTAAMVTAIVNAGFILAGSIQVGSSMTLDPAGGLVITQTDGRQTYFRSDGSGNQLIGQAILDALVVLGSLGIFGQNNFLNGLLTLGTGVGDPTSKPGVTTNWDSRETTYTVNFNPRGLYEDSTRWLFTESLLGGNVWEINKTTGVHTLVKNLPSNFLPLGGVTKVGTSWYVLGKDGNRSGAWWVFIFDSSWVKTGEWAPSAGSGNESLTIGVDGSGLLIAKRTMGNTLYISQYTVAGVESSYVSTGTTWGAVDLTGVLKVAVDTATVRFVVAATTGIRVFNTSTGARVSTEEWPAAAASTVGISHDGTVWHTFDGHTVWHYTNLIGTYDFGFTWVDNDAGGAGTAETRISALRVVAPTKRARWTISLPSPPPDDGTTDGANTGSLYAAPTGGTLVLQTALAEPVLSATYSTLATSGTAPPVTSGFAARIGAIGRLIAAATNSDGTPFFDLRGDGAGSYFGPLGFDSNNNAVGRNGAVLVSTVSAPSSNAAPNSTTNVTIAGLSISVTSPGTKAVYMVTLQPDVQITTAGTNLIELLVDGTAQAVLSVFAGATASRGGTTKTWRITGLSAGSHAFTARTRMLTAATGANVLAAHTTMTVVQA